MNSFCIDTLIFGQLEAVSNTSVCVGINPAAALFIIPQAAPSLSYILQSLLYTLSGFLLLQILNFTR